MEKIYTSTQERKKLFTEMLEKYTAIKYNPSKGSITISDLTNKADSVSFSKVELHSFDKRLASLLPYFKRIHGLPYVTTLLRYNWPYLCNPKQIYVAANHLGNKMYYAVNRLVRISYNDDDPGLLVIDFKGVCGGKTEDGIKFVTYQTPPEPQQIVVSTLVSKEWLEVAYPGSIAVLEFGIALGLSSDALAQTIEGVRKDTVKEKLPASLTVQSMLKC